MTDVRYEHFTFPFAILYDGLQKLVVEPPSLTLDPTEKERLNGLLTWLRENARSGAAPLDLPNWLLGRQWNALIAASIENGIGTVLCPGCNQLWPLASMKREHWDYMDMGEKTGVVVAAAGRQFKCPNGHEVFRTEDYFGYM
jgi:hypothetical protein